MNSVDFVNKLLELVNKYKTIYTYGTWGQHLTNELITAKAKQYPWWYTDNNVKILRSYVGKGYFSFDCVGMIKAILWGWNGSLDKNGGAKYQSNGVPDMSANGLIERCTNVSTDFSKIELGEIVWMNGHVGVYYKDGKVIECSTSGNDNVQITNLKGRGWKKHGKLIYVDYTKKSSLKYRAYVQKVGWQEWKNSGEIAGTTGQQLRLEAIQIDYDNVEAKAHIQKDGWIDYGKINKDTIIGTTEEAKRLECLCLKGNFKYRVHIEKSGWTCYTNADGICTLGSVGQGLRIEAIEIVEN